MPNENPSGPNQPLNQHPRPAAEHLVLGKDSLLVTPLPQGGVDTLVVPPPPEGVVREVYCDYGSTQQPMQLNALLFGNTLATPPAMDLIYKDGNGNEIAIGTATFNTDLRQFRRLNPGNNVGFVLTPDDLGLFARVTENSDGVFAFISEWQDVRGVQRQDTVLTTAYQQITPVVPEGNTVIPALGTTNQGVAPLFLFHNYDPANNADVTLRVTIGGQSVEWLQTLGMGESGEMQFQVPNLPPDAKVEAKLDALLAEDVVLSFAYGLTNQSPVRQDQGGAF